LRVKVGERSERIVARDPPAKGRYGVGGSSACRRTSAQKAYQHRRGDDHTAAASTPTLRDALFSDPTEQRRFDYSCGRRVKPLRFAADSGHGVGKARRRPFTPKIGMRPPEEKRSARLAP